MMLLQQRVEAPNYDCAPLREQVSLVGVEGLSSRQELDYWHCRASDLQMDLDLAMLAVNRNAASNDYFIDQRNMYMERSLVLGLSALFLLIVGSIIIHQMMNNWRMDRFAARELNSLVDGIVRLDRNGVARYQATVDRAKDDASTVSGKFWVRRGPSVSLEQLEQTGEAGRLYVEETLEPAYVVAIRGEKIRQNIEYEAASFARGIERLTIENEQKRWDKASGEITEIRRVLEATVAELVHNPALEGRLDYILKRLTLFSDFMKDAKNKSVIDDSALGELTDELLTKAFEEDIDRMTSTKGRSTGATNGAHAR